MLFYTFFLIELNLNEKTFLNEPRETVEINAVWFRFLGSEAVFHGGGVKLSGTPLIVKILIYKKYEYAHGGRHKQKPIGLQNSVNLYTTKTDITTHYNYYIS